MPIRIFRLGEEPRDDLRSSTTAEERFELVRVLTARTHELGGGGPPTYERGDIPVRVVRPT